MSYILDALRRADAERDRGAVPGLHSQALPGATAAPAANNAAALWALAGAGAAIGAVALAWLLLWREQAPPVQPAAVAAAPATVVPAPAPATSATPAPPAPLADPGPRTADSAATTAAPTPRIVAAPMPTPAPSLAPARRQVAASAAAAPIATASPSPPAAAAAPPITPYDRLPDDVKRALPVLVVGGAIYSDNAATRMLIVGGQLLYEGDTIAPGLLLEQIRPKSAVLRWKEWRYELPL